jgi:hypothetical protein
MIKKIIQIIIVYTLIIFVFTGGAIQCNNPIEPPAKIKYSTKKFNYPLTSGITWTYKYYYYYWHFSGEKVINGTQYWTIIDSVSNEILTNFKFRIIKQDTIIKIFYYIPPDTSFIIDTSFFYIERNSSNIIIHSPYTYYSAGDTLKDYIDTSNIIKFGYISDDDGTIYKNNIGLFTYMFSNNTNTIIKEELEFVKIEN